MSLQTRKPTGKPSWPMLLLAGAEKAGKSYSAAVATSSDLIGRTWWVTIGEDQPDEYGQLGDFDIVEHDGSYRGILAALRAIAHQPKPAQGVPLLVVDSMTRLWDLIKENAQNVANDRAARKSRGNQDGDAQITTDLWNAAAAQWAHVMDAIRSFDGPVLLTARLDVVAVMDERGQPTKDKQSKVQAHKSLPYDVGGVIEMPTRGETWISGVRSVRLRLAERTRQDRNFTIDGFWRQLGLADTVTSSRDHAAPEAEGKPFDAEGIAAGLDRYEDLDQLGALWDELRVGKNLGHLVDGVPLGDLLRARKTLLERRAVEPVMALVPPAAPTVAVDAYEDETPF